MARRRNPSTENINEIILGILSIDNTKRQEMDYASYRELINNIFLEVKNKKRNILPLEIELLKEELTRIKGKRGRFKIKVKKAKITSNSFAVGRITNVLAGKVGNNPINANQEVNIDTEKSISDLVKKILEIQNFQYFNTENINNINNIQTSQSNEIVKIKEVIEKLIPTSLSNKITTEPVVNNNTSNLDEIKPKRIPFSINEEVLRILNLEDKKEIDYQQYHDAIKKRLFVTRMGGQPTSPESDELLREEFKRIRRVDDKNIILQVRKVKINEPSDAIVKSPTNQYQYDTKGEIVKSEKGSIVPIESIQKVQVEDITENKQFTKIEDILDSILRLMMSKFNFDKKQEEEQRKEEETKKREKKESGLEAIKKGFGTVVALTKKMLSPFEALIERIKKFLFFTILGRAFGMFMDWLKDKNNREKFNSLIEFLTDHWPAIAGLYILFGTSFGKLIRGLMKAAIRMTAALVMNIGKIKAFAKKYKALVGLGLGVAALGSGKLANFLGKDEESPNSAVIAKSETDLKDARTTIDKIKDTEIPKLNIGGIIPTQQKPQKIKTPALYTGGLIPDIKMPNFNLGGFVPKFAMGGLSPMSLQQGVPITGAGQDDTLIAAKTGEAVLTEKDQKDLSQQYINRETGQPLNIPQYLSDRKSSFVNLNNVKITGGYYKGGIVNNSMTNISKFNTGGIVGGKGRRSIRDITGPGVGDWERGTTSLESLRRRIPSDMARPRGNNSGIPTVPLSQSSYFGRILSGSDVTGKGFADNPNYTGPMPGAGSGTRDRMPGTTPSNNPFYTERKNSKFTTPVRRGNILKLQKGGLIDNAKNFIQGMFNFGRNPQPPAKPKPKVPLPEFQNPEALALLNTIRSAEHYKGTDPYSAIYGGGKAPLSQMTIQEVIQMGNTGKLPMKFGGKSAGYGSGSAATGAYQFMPFTLQDLIRRGLAKPNEMFTKTVQDRLGWELAKGRGVNLSGLRKTGLNQSIMDMMAPEWASFPYSGEGGKSFYGQPVKSPEFLRNIFLQSLSGYKAPKKQDGGEIKESTGINIPGGTADRQLTALQPGEYVLPVETVTKLGLPTIERLVASTDSNSEAYLKKGKINRPEITPYNSFRGSGESQIINLPPIMASSGMGGGGSNISGGSRVPPFSTVSPYNERVANAKIYGLVG